MNGGNRGGLPDDSDGVHCDDAAMSCDLAIELMSARLDGVLDLVRSEHLDTHLAGCAACRATSAAVQAQQRLFRLRPAEHVPDRTIEIIAAIEDAGLTDTHVQGMRSWVSWSIAAAAAALVVVGGVIFMFPGDTSRTAQRPGEAELIVTRAALTPADSGQASVLTFTISNSGSDPDALVDVDLPESVTTDVALHVVRDTNPGTPAMRSVDELTVTPGGTKHFDAWASHVMLLDLTEPLVNGVTVPVTFRFVESPPISIDVPVD